MAKKLINDKQNGIHVVADNMPEFHAMLEQLARREVLVGIPAENTERDDPESKAAGMTNAALAYIHDNGAPEQHIPARPFMVPGIEAAREKITDTLTRTAKKVLGGATGSKDLFVGLNRAGLIAQMSIQATIRAGIPPPLADSTLRKRAAKGRKGAQKELDRREAGLAPGMHNAVPLMDTNEMMKKITYVIRNKSDRSK